MRSATVGPAKVEAQVQPPHDVRAFWRILLVVIAPLPMLAKGIYYMLSPVEGDASFTATVTALDAHPQIADAMKLLDAVFMVSLIPAVVAVAWVARRGAPRLTRAGAVIALTGFLAGLTLLGGPVPAMLTAQHDLDRGAMGDLYDAVRTEPILGLGSLLFIVAVVFGLGLLGEALRRCGAAPAWMGVALILGGVTHPFIPNHVGQGIGLLVAAVGFAGASVGLLRMSDSEFDLPPTAR